MFEGHGGKGRQEAAAAGMAAHEILDVSASLSPLPPPAAALAAYREAAGSIVRYPDIAAGPLCKAYAAKHNLPPDQVLAGAGSTEFLYLIVRALRPGRVFTFVPTYSDYGDSARVAGIPFEPLRTTLESGFARNLGTAAATHSPGDLLFLCNPNNPTGQYISTTVLQSFAQEHPELTLVVDEAYAEFIGPDATAAAAAMPPNLIVLRSPTKFFTIPGLRLGYCVGHAQTIARLLDAKAPWTVSAPALAVGEVLLSCDAHAARVRAAVETGRTQLATQLARQTDLWVCPSPTNFFLCRIPGAAPSASAVRQRCLQHGVVIRDCTNFKGLDSHYIRVAVRPPEENERLVKALAAALAPDCRSH